MRLTSTRNPAVKFVRSLDRAAVRRERGEYLVEGVRLVTEAMQTQQRASLALYEPDLLARSEAGAGIIATLHDWADRAYEVDEHVLQAATATETPAGILAVIAFPATTPLQVHEGQRLGLVLDGLADPGNVGTLLRSADAFGVSYVVATPGTADLFAPKVVRSGMGAHFRLPLYPSTTWRDIMAALPGSRFVAAEARTGTSEESFHWGAPTTLVIGGEASGLSSEARQVIAEYVYIPMKDGVESLNAAVAGSILLHRAWMSKLKTHN